MYIHTYINALQNYNWFHAFVGFADELRRSTGGKAFTQCAFHHWQILPGCPFEDGSKTAAVIFETRKRKGLHDAIPPLNRYLDRL